MRCAADVAFPSQVAAFKALEAVQAGSTLPLAASDFDDLTHPGASRDAHGTRQARSRSVTRPWPPTSRSRSRIPTRGTRSRRRPKRFWNWIDWRTGSAPFAKTATWRASRVWTPERPASSILTRSQCLRIALDIEQATGGAFDIAYRSQPHRAASELMRLGDRTPVVAVLDTARGTRSGWHRQRLRSGSHGSAAGRLGPGLRTAACEQEYGARATLATGNARAGKSGSVPPTNPRSLTLSSVGLQRIGERSQGATHHRPARGAACDRTIAWLSPRPPRGPRPMHCPRRLSS